MRILKIAVVAALLSLPVASVQASVLGSIIADGRIHGLSDTSADIAVSFNGATGDWELNTGSLGVGDILVAGIGFDTLERLGAPDVALSGAGGFSMLKVRTSAAAGINLQGIALSSFVFDAPSVAEWGAIVDDLFGGTAGLKKSSEGALVMLFDGSATDFDRIAPPATLAGSAGTLLGAEFAELGFTGATVGGNVQDNATGEGWIAVGPASPALGSTVPLNAGVVGTSFAGGLSLLEGFGGLTLLPLISPVELGTVDFTGSGLLQGYGDGVLPVSSAVGPWQIGNDADFSFRAVPEPGSVIVWTLLVSVVGGGLYRRRKCRA